MKLKVNKDACIGCGACQSVCPSVFDINDDGYAYVTEKVVPKEDEENAKSALENCPTGAIVETE